MAITNKCSGIKIDKRKKLAPQIDKIIECALTDMANAYNNGNEYGRGVSEGLSRLIYKLKDANEIVKKLESKGGN